MINQSRISLMCLHTQVTVSFAVTCRIDIFNITLLATTLDKGWLYENSNCASSFCFETRLFLSILTHRDTDWEEFISSYPKPWTFSSLVLSSVMLCMVCSKWQHIERISSIFIFILWPERKFKCLAGASCMLLFFVIVMPCLNSAFLSLMHFI